MRAVAALIICVGCSSMPTRPPTEPEEVHPINSVHAAAENALTADKRYGSQARLYLVEVLRVEKQAGGFVLAGVGAGSLEAGDVPGSEFKIARSGEAAFIALQAGQGVTVRARYTGTARRVGAYKGYVVTFEDASLVPRE